MKMTRYFLFVFLFFLCLQGKGQGWFRTYELNVPGGSGLFLLLQAEVKVINNNLLLLVTYEDVVRVNGGLILINMNENGEEIWRTYFFKDDYFLTQGKLIIKANNEIVITAYQTPEKSNGNKGILLYNLSNKGDILGEIFYENLHLSASFDNFPLWIEDDNYLLKNNIGSWILHGNGLFTPIGDLTNFLGLYNSNSYIKLRKDTLSRSDFFNNTYWETIIPSSFRTSSSDAFWVDTNLVLVNYPKDSNLSEVEVFDTSGNKIAAQSIPPFNPQERLILSKDSFGNFHAFNSIDTTQIRIGRFNPETGDIKTEQFSLNIKVLPQSFSLYGNKAIVSGRYDYFVGLNEKPFLCYIDYSGVINSKTIRGRIVRDNNMDCQADTLDSSLAGWLVEAFNDGDTVRTTSRIDGSFEMIVSDTAYTVTAIPPSDYWSLCDSGYLVSLPGATDTATVEIPVQIQALCPLLTVDISTDFLEPCYDAIYSVYYQNQGTDTAFNAEVVVNLDPAMTVVNTTIPWSSQSGNSYTFEVGDIPPGIFDFFLIQVSLACDTIGPGQTHCVDAVIFPDTICNTGWNGPNIEVRVACENDSVRFFIKNTGEDMIAEREYIIIEDNIILRIGNFQLNRDEIHEVAVEVKDGSTYRLEAEQAIGFPSVLGNEKASASIERCGVIFGEPFNPGYITQFPDDDGEPFLSIDCRQNTIREFRKSKAATPEGFEENHLIEPNQDIEYSIHFQNTTTDTVNNIIVRDTLSGFLDIQTVQAGASSHPYEFEIYENRILKFTFTHIQLPDSMANPLLSRGFVKFRVAQLPDLPVGTQIFNTAGISFEHGQPQVTNEVFHQVGVDFIDIIIDTEEPLQERPVLKVQPNPFSQSVVIEIEGADKSAFVLDLYSVTGQKVESHRYKTGRFKLDGRHLPTGLYFFQVRTENGIGVGAGKLVRR